MGKVHGSLARAGKVKGQTPKVDPEDKPKPLTGRARLRVLYNRRCVHAVTIPGVKPRMNTAAIQALRKANSAPRTE
ncbi:30S ribosomal protein S30e [Fonticula alba]|uniref:40S ribosomal protein S30 n=1 Tax=Fonticula alba TaxID=691883 RepID=A0A058Z9L3_FONAL|nr:30S ribosomal protein S30e [Fonticula alba]KCV70969.1 30S ribosomal protein S30e [Fonticula alba]|eukprot:XP_009494092.1 30S ribosomal protein S30e [Fonticula alba]